VLDFLGTTINETTYTTVMTSFSNQLATMGEMSSNRTFIFHAIVIIAFSLYDSDARMFMYGDSKAELVFGQEVQAAAITSREGLCNTYPLTGKYISGSFNPSAKSFKLTMPLIVDPSFVDDPLHVLGDSLLRNALNNKTSCAAQLKNHPYIQDTQFSEYIGGASNFQFDVRSIAVAIYMNSNQNFDWRYLTQIRGRREGLIGFTDPYYQNPPMSTIWCLDKQSNYFTDFTDKQKNQSTNVCFVPDSRYDDFHLYYPVGVQLYPDKTKCITRRTKKRSNEGMCKFSLCECPSAVNFSDCNKQQWTFGLFYVNDDLKFPGRSRPAIELGLKMENILIADEVNGDKEQARTVADVLALALNVQQARARADEIINDAWAQNQSFNQLLSV